MPIIEGLGAGADLPPISESLRLVMAEVENAFANRIKPGDVDGGDVDRHLSDQGLLEAMAVVLAASSNSGLVRVTYVPTPSKVVTKYAGEYQRLLELGLLRVGFPGDDYSLDELWSSRYDPAMVSKWKAVEYLSKRTLEHELDHSKPFRQCPGLGRIWYGVEFFEIGGGDCGLKLFVAPEGLFPWEVIMEACEAPGQPSDSDVLKAIILGVLAGQ